MSVIVQDGDSVLMLAARKGMTEVVSLLLEAGANTDLQNKVCQDYMHGGVVLEVYFYLCGIEVPVVPFPTRFNHAEHNCLWASLCSFIVKLGCTRVITF